MLAELAELAELAPCRGGRCGCRELRTLTVRCGLNHRLQELLICCEAQV